MTKTTITRPLLLLLFLLLPLPQCTTMNNNFSITTITNNENNCYHLPCTPASIQVFDTGIDIEMHLGAEIEWCRGTGVRCGDTGVEIQCVEIQAKTPTKTKNIDLLIRLKSPLRRRGGPRPQSHNFTDFNFKCQSLSISSEPPDRPRPLPARGRGRPKTVARWSCSMSCEG